MRTRALIIGLAVALAAGIGATCESGDPHGGGGGPFPAPIETTKLADGRTTCPEVEFRTPEERCFTLQTFVETKFSPYDVYLNISGGNGAYPPHIPVAAGGWKHGIVYRTGLKLTITMTVEPSKNGSRDGFCAITDGANYARDDVGPAQGPVREEHYHPGQDVAICVLTTGQ